MAPLAGRGIADIAFMMKVIVRDRGVKPPDLRFPAQANAVQMGCGKIRGLSQSIPKY